MFAHHTAAPAVYFQPLLELFFKPVPAMTMLAAKLFMFLFLFQHKPCSEAVVDNCVFLGEEEKNSLYEDGDVVIGGLFPLHYSPLSSLPTYITKPTPHMYK